MWRHVGLFDLGQLSQQFFLFVSELPGHLDLDFDVQITGTSATWVGHASSSNPENMSRLRSRRDIERVASFQDRNLDDGAQCSLGKRDGHLADQVRSLALEQRMISDVNLDVKITSWASQ